MTKIASRGGPALIFAPELSYGLWKFSGDLTRFFDFERP